MSGHDTKIFAVKPCESLDCPICLNILNDPRQCLNGHCFCNGCISNSVEIKHECPICKVHLTVDTLGRNLHVQNMIAVLPTLCKSRFIPVGNFDTDDLCFEESEITECQWSGTLSERDTHFEQDCGFKIVKCPSALCSTLMPRRCVEVHMEYYEYTEEKCLSCFKTFKNAHEADHHSIGCTQQFVNAVLGNMVNVEKNKSKQKQQVKKTQATEQNEILKRANSIGTAIEYLNRKGKWIAGNVIVNKPSLEVDTVYVLNVYDHEILVKLGDIRLKEGSVMTFQNDEQYYMWCEKGEDKEQILQFKGKDTIYNMISVPNTIKMSHFGGGKKLSIRMSRKLSEMKFALFV